MPGELYQIYANKTAINEKRTAIKGSGFRASGYWSSREDSRGSEYFGYLGDGYIGYNSKDDNSCYALGFLALEV